MSTQLSLVPAPETKLESPSTTVVAAPSPPPRPEHHFDVVRRLVKELGKRDPLLVARFAAECAERATKKSQGKGEYATRHAGAARATAAECAGWIDDLVRRPEGMLGGKVTARSAVDCATRVAIYESLIWDAREAQVEALQELGGGR